MVLDLDFTKLVDMFQSAINSGLKWPQMRVEVDRFPELHIGVGRERDVLFVRKADRGWIGRIDGVTKRFQPRDTITSNELKALLVMLADDPHDMAVQYSRRTHRCCFCNEELTTDNSTAAGYGPKCAKRYGLPWG